MTKLPETITESESFIEDDENSRENSTQNCGDKLKLRLMSVSTAAGLFPLQFLGCVSRTAWVRYARFAAHVPQWHTQLCCCRPSQVRIVKDRFDDVRVRVYVPSTCRPSGASIFYVHGGGWCIFRAYDYDGMIARFAVQNRCVVFSIDYGLAPEHPFPSSCDECERALLCLMREGNTRYNIDTNNIVAMGDSAGANIVAVLTHRLNKKNQTPKLKVLLYPVVQCINMRTSSYLMSHRFSVLAPRFMVSMALCYVGKSPKPRHVTRILQNRHIDFDDRQFQSVHRYLTLDGTGAVQCDIFNHNHYDNKIEQIGPIDKQLHSILKPLMYSTDLCPLIADDFTGLPPACVVTVGLDPLRDDGLLYGQRLRSGGVPVLELHYADAPHGVVMFNLKIARQIIDDVSEFVAQQHCT